MPYNISFISLGCAKNQVNCEQMMASVQAAGHTIQAQPEGADVVVVNTCGFLQSACEEAIDNILEMAELKRAGQVKKILVTGCMTQRYKQDVLHELPEVDGILGTGSYGDICAAIDEVMGRRPAALLSRQRPHRRAGRRAHPLHAPLVRLPPHRGGVRQPLRLLRDPLPPGQVPQPPHGGPAGRGPGAGVRRRQGAAGHRPGHHPVRHRPERRAPALGPPAGAVQAGLPLDPAPLPVPGRDHGGPDRHHRGGAQDRQVPGHPHPALQRRHFEGHEPPGHQGGAAGPAGRKPP